jgi:hypothetical protein
MKKHIIALIGHLAIATLHYYLMMIKGITEFQFISFAVVHYVWHDLVINGIYGLKEGGR